VSPVELFDGRGRGGAKSYEGEKVWSSINNAILSGPHPRLEIPRYNHTGVLVGSSGNSNICWGGGGG
jgi:hypothetical protein